MKKALKIFIIAFAILIVLGTFMSALKVTVERIRTASAQTETAAETIDTTDESRYGLIDGGANTETQWGKLYFIN